MGAIFKKGEKHPFTVKLVDKNGDPARFDGVATVVVDGTAGQASDVAADGLSGSVECVGLGKGQVQVTGDADLGDGVRPLTILGDFEVVAEEAVGGTVEFGPTA